MLTAVKLNFDVVSHRDRFLKPSNGYQDHILEVRLPNGRSAEIQIHRADILYAKEIGIGHQLYEEIRRAYAARQVSPGSPALQRWISTLTNKTREYYGGIQKAYDQSSGGTD